MLHVDAASTAKRRARRANAEPAGNSRSLALADMVLHSGTVHRSNAAVSSSGRSVGQRQNKWRSEGLPPLQGAGSIICTVYKLGQRCIQSMSRAAELPDEIREGLFLSSLQARQSEDILRLLNITTICDLSTLPPFMSKPPKFFGIKVHEYSVLDDEEADIMPAATAVLSVIASLRQEAASGAVLVHCQGGVSRSASVVIYALMTLESTSLAAAYRHVKSKRPCIRPNAGFMRQLIAAGFEPFTFPFSLALLSHAVICMPRAVYCNMCRAEVAMSGQATMALGKHDSLKFLDEDDPK
jgi:predicted protein tyrosine phosphatase